MNCTDAPSSTFAITILGASGERHAKALCTVLTPITLKAVAVGCLAVALAGPWDADFVSSSCASGNIGTLLCGNSFR